MKPRLAILLALLPALPAAGQTETVVSPSEFRDYAEGYTLRFENDGEPAGAEAFGPEGHVTWRTPEGVCIEGLWRPYGDELCFYYGIEEVVQCWSVLRDEKGLKVRSTGEVSGEPEMTYRITGRDKKPLLCGEPSLRTRGGPAFSSPAPRPARW